MRKINFKHLFMFIVLVAILSISTTKTYAGLVDLNMGRRIINDGDLIKKEPYSKKLALLFAIASNDVYFDADPIKHLKLEGFTLSKLQKFQNAGMQAAVSHKEVDKSFIDTIGASHIVSIGFRGSNELLDWYDNSFGSIVDFFTHDVFGIEDVNFPDSDIDFSNLFFWVPNNNACYNCVHGGFMGQLSTFIDHDNEVIIGNKTLEQIHNDPPDDYLFVIYGHSLGGAVAQLYAGWLYEKGVHKDNIIVYAYASPGPGRKEFHDLYANKIQAKIFNDIYDPVPFVTSLRNFGHINISYIYDFDNHQYVINSHNEAWMKGPLVTVYPEDHDMEKYIDRAKDEYFECCNDITFSGSYSSGYCSQYLSCEKVSYGAGGNPACSSTPEIYQGLLTIAAIDQDHPKRTGFPYCSCDVDNNECAWSNVLIFNDNSSTQNLENDNIVEDTDNFYSILPVILSTILY